MVTGKPELYTLYKNEKVSLHENDIVIHVNQITNKTVGDIELHVKLYEVKLHKNKLT